MRRAAPYPTLVAGALGLALLAVGVVYLTVECQSLPGLLGPTQGDTAPRTGLGIAGLALGVVFLSLALAVSTRRRRH